MEMASFNTTETVKAQGSWRAQSEEHVTPDLGVVSSSPSLGVEIT